MRYLGIDISSNSTGWSAVDFKRGYFTLIDFGLIKPDGGMSHIQKLYLLGNEFERIFAKLKPENIAIEETIFVNNRKTMKILTRFGGIILFKAYEYGKIEANIYEPKKWKKILGVGGNAKKADVQLEVCRIFEKMSKDKLSSYKQKISDVYTDIEKTNEDALSKENIEIRMGKDGINKTEARKLIRKDLKKIIYKMEERFDQISMNIYTESGINSDIGDSVGITIADIKVRNNLIINEEKDDKKEK
ncbi:MAG TPA: crossover junction endodeoxyribonuclease RuvC [Candidatus Paceibacterota bacterium]|nr:crossover junction endodeoxyribonuclease RuvC [Candidatus Paceibacterota bacterium]